VPQGSVLGPTLFNLYVRHLPSQLQHSECLQYADDVNIYRVGDSVCDIVSKLSSDIERLRRYFTTRGLTLNPSKTTFMVVRRPTVQLPEGSHLQLGDTLAQPVSYVKYLGIYIDEHLTFKKQVDHVCAQVGKKLGAFRNCRRRTYYFGLVQSCIEYASTAYVHSLAKSNYDRLLSLSRRSLRIIFGFPSSTHVTVITSGGRSVR